MLVLSSSHACFRTTGLSSFLWETIREARFEARDQVFDRHFLHWHILAPLLTRGIHLGTKEDPNPETTRLHNVKEPRYDDRRSSHY
jgi:hypothetical protein